MKIYNYQSKKFCVYSTPFSPSSQKCADGVSLFPLTSPPTKVDLIEEISSYNGVISSVCDFSRQTHGTVIVGAEVKLASLYRQSAIVSHNGELIEVADSCTALPPFVPSTIVKVFTVGSLPCALLVGNDAIFRPLFYKVAKKCSLILSLPCEMDNDRENLLREFSDETGVPVLVCSTKTSFLTLPMLN